MLPNLRTLKLIRTKIKGTGLANLSKFRNLTSLTIQYNGNPLDDSGLQNLQSLTSLQELEISGGPLLVSCNKGLSETIFKSPVKVYLNGNLGVNNYLTLASLFPMASSLEVKDSNIGNKELTALLNLQNLRTLKLIRTKISGEGLASLSKLRNLTSLTIQYNGNPLHDLVLQNLQNLTSLQELEISGGALLVSCNKGLSVGILKLPVQIYLNRDLLDNTYSIIPSRIVTDEDLHTLASLFPMASVLEVNDRHFGTDITDKGLTALQNLPNLRTLKLDWVKITNAGLANLSHLSDLTSLTIWKNQGTIDDLGLQNLQSSTSLQELDIGGSFTDQGLKIIGNFVRLVVLKLSRNGTLLKVFNFGKLDRKSS